MTTKVVVSSKTEAIALRAFSSIQGFISYRTKRTLEGKSMCRSSTLNKLHSYHFIPLQPEIIIKQLVFIYDYLARESEANPLVVNRRPSFLDAGCGPGNIMLLAGAAGFKPHGLELDIEAIETAKYFNPFHELIQHRNILTFKNYGDFDVIYYYCPIAGPQQVKFEECVEDQMKVGAILIPHFKKSQRILKDGRFELLTEKFYRPIYKKIK